MDAVRFGRALGAGARQAVKTTMAAVDAATAQNPSGKKASTGTRAGTGVSGAGTSTSGPVSNQGTSRAKRASDAPYTPQTPSQAAPRTKPQKAAHRAAQTVVQARSAKRGLKQGGRRFSEAAWKPFVRLSGVLWMEVTGVFFGIFALFAIGGVWHLRGQWHSSAGGRRQLVGAIAMAAIFTYFCISNFVRARRRERRR